MDLQTVSDAMKLVGSVVGSVLAIAAVVGRYTRGRKLTRLGLGVVIGILFALSLTISSLFLDSQITKKDSAKRDAQVAATIHQVNRGLYPLDKISIAYDLELLPGDAQLDAYSRELAAKLDPIVDYDRAAFAALGKPHPPAPSVRGIVGSGGGSDGELSYSIDPSSALGPPASIRPFLARPPIWVEFSRVAASDAELERGATHPNQEADFVPGEGPTRSTIAYTVNKTGAATVGTQSAGDLERDETGPALVSLLDFDGGQIRVWAGESDGSECTGRVDPANFKINMVLITLSSGQHLYLTGDMLHRVVGSSGCPIYVYNLPTTDDSMLAAFK